MGSSQHINIQTDDLTQDSTFERLHPSLGYTYIAKFLKKFGILLKTLFIYVLGSILQFFVRNSQECEDMLRVLSTHLFLTVGIKNHNE